VTNSVAGELPAMLALVAVEADDEDEASSAAVS
jgi:hypothetical protein